MPLPSLLATAHLDQAMAGIAGSLASMGCTPAEIAEWMHLATERAAKQMADAIQAHREAQRARHYHYADDPMECWLYGAWKESRAYGRHPAWDDSMEPQVPGAPTARDVKRHPEGGFLVKMEEAEDARHDSRR